MKHLVFVYGSLKKGFRNHKILENSKFLEETRTKERVFDMQSFNVFPAVYKTNDPDNGYSIEGELYRVDKLTMDRLDKLESNGHLYQREQVRLANGQIAWMYICLHALPIPNRLGVCTNSYTQLWQGPTDLVDLKEFETLPESRGLFNRKECFG